MSALYQWRLRRRPRRFPEIIITLSGVSLDDWIERRDAWVWVWRIKMKKKKNKPSAQLLHRNRGRRTETHNNSLLQDLSSSASRSDSSTRVRDGEAVAKKTVGYAAAVKRWRRNRCNVFAKKRRKVLQHSARLTFNNSTRNPTKNIYSHRFHVFHPSPQPAHFRPLTGV